MYIKKISLKNFRNYLNLEFVPIKDINILTGNNAQGKTNILEAIYLASTGKSYRASKIDELLNWENPNFFYVSIEILKFNRKIKIEIKYDESKRKSFFINGIKKNKVSDLLSIFNVVFFVPEDLNLIKGSPSYRRNFLNDYISQVSPQYYHFLKQYEKVLAQRNNLLKAIRERKSSKDFLEIWDEQLWDYGSKIIYKRLESLKKFSNISKEIHLNITDKEELLDINYNCTFKVEEKSNLEEIKNGFKNYTIKLLKEEIIRGITLVGPHRDDLDFKINNNSIQKFGSQGQQRTTVLSLKLAEMEIINKEQGHYPVLLLDDVMSELDLNRRKYLLDFIKNKVQTFITTTNLNSFGEDLKELSKVYKVESGKII